MKNVQTSLRSLSPKLYEYMIEKFDEKFHIQPYDLQINAVKEKNGFNIIVKYGERFDHQSEQFFSLESVEKRDESVMQFIQEAGEACKKVLIDDYFRMMTP